MGMFDYIVCKTPLPDSSNADGRGFQTKNTDALALDTYTITAEGRLIHTDYDTEMVPEAERPYPNAKDWRACIGMMRQVNSRHVDTNYHGDITFYDTKTTYTARFIGGKLASISVGGMWMPEPATP